MAKLKKNIDKGIAYLKKNGARAAAERLCRKIQLSREVDYEKWLENHRKSRAARLPERWQNQAGRQPARRNPDFSPEAVSAMSVNPAENIKVVISGRLPGHIEETDFFLFTERGDILEPDTLERYAAAMQEHPEAELFYCDSDQICEDGKHFQNPQCKPDFDAYYLQSTDYIGGGFLVSGRIVKALGAPEQLYDYLLRCTEMTDKIVHVPEILYHAACRRTGAGEYRTEEKQALALQAHFKRSGINAKVSRGMQPWTRKITFQYAEPPLVSILIPNKDHREDLEKCVDSIRRYAGYASYEILIIENNSTSEEIFSFYDTLQRNEKNVRVITYEGDFNYSKINNFGAREARGEYFLFLNNDTEMTSEGCLRELMNYALQPAVGAVGAQMFYGDNTIQHAGVILGYGGVAGHAFEGISREQARQITPVISARAYSAVTAACMVVRRSLFEELGGFDEELGVAYNDIDLCLRIGRAGKKVIYTPYAQLFHYESRTRGLELTDEKAERIRRETELFQKRWRELLKKGDPCYSPNLTLEKPDFSLRV